MPVILTDVTHYNLVINGGPNGSNGFDAAIGLTTAEGNVSMRFFPEGAVIPANSRSTLGGKPFFIVNLRYAQFAPSIDLLRNEKPVRFTFDDSTLLANISALNEPVGEGGA